MPTDRAHLPPGRLKAALPFLLVALALITAVALSGREIVHHIAAVEAWIATLGPWGVIAFILLFAIATSLLMPDTLLCIVAGALFGLGWGVVVVLVGSWLAASAQYFLSHKLLRQRIQNFLLKKPSLAAIQRAVITDELKLQFLLRLTPLNPATMSYILGAAGVRFRNFQLASVALIPNLFLEVYFGHAGKHAARIAGGGGNSGHLHEIVMFGSLVTCIVVMVVVSKLARKALMSAVHKVEGQQAPP